MKKFINCLAATQILSLAFIAASCGDGEKIVPLKQAVLNREIQSYSVGPSAVNPDSKEAEYFSLPATMTSPTAAAVFKYRYGRDAVTITGQDELYFVKIDSPIFPNRSIATASEITSSPSRLSARSSRSPSSPTTISPRPSIPSIRLNRSRSSRTANASSCRWPTSARPESRTSVCRAIPFSSTRMSSIPPAA